MSIPDRGNWCLIFNLSFTELCDRWGSVEFFRILIFPYTSKHIPTQVKLGFSRYSVPWYSLTG